MKTQFCRKCGKEFVPAPEHRFVDSFGRYYCKWTCYNHRDECKTVKPKREKIRPVELCDSNGNVLKTFASANEAAEITGFTAPYIRDACRTGTKYHDFLWKYKSKEVI